MAIDLSDDSPLLVSTEDLSVMSDDADPCLIGNRNAKRSYWFGTLMNYTEDELARIKSVRSAYTCIGKELAPTTLTPHLHIVWRFGRGQQLTYNQLKRKFQRMDLNYFQQTDFGKKVRYAKKVEMIYEFGGSPEDRAAIRKSQAMNQADMHAQFKVLALDGKISAIPADYQARFYLYFQGLAKEGLLLRAEAEAMALHTYHDFKPWQGDLDLRLAGSVDPREIYWIYDSVGGAGKSWFANDYAMRNHDAEVILPGKAADMAAAITPGKRVYLFDVPRVAGDKVAWGFIEQVKNGRIFNSKYQSRNIYMRIPHVVVLSNAMPPTTTDTTGFSEDRIKVTTLSSFNPNMFFIQ